MEAVIYARFSSAEQAKGYSLERQLSNGREFAEREGYTVGREIADEGKSAYHGRNRAEGSELFEFEAEARSGQHKGRTLLVENIDRLSRQGPKEAAKLIWSLNDAGVTVRTWHDGQSYRGSDLMEIFGLIIRAQTAFEESDKKSKRASDSWIKRHSRIAEGEKTRAAKIPSWIVRTADGFELDPAKAKTLNDIFDLYLSGLGVPTIAQRLNESKVPTFREGAQTAKAGWRDPSIYRLLNSRSVMGDYVNTAGETLASDFYPRAITPAKFAEVQDMLADRKKNYRGSNKQGRNLLKGMLKCGACNGSGVHIYKPEMFLDRKRMTAKHGLRTYRVRTGEYEQVRCDSARRKGGCTNNAYFDYRVVETSVLNAVLDLADFDRADSRVASINATIAETRHKAETIESQISNLIDLLADGGSKALLARVTKLEAESEALRAEITKQEAELELARAKPEAEQIAEIRRLRNDLTNEDYATRIEARAKVRRALFRVIDQVALMPDDTFMLISREDSWHFDKTGRELGGGFNF